MKEDYFLLSLALLCGVGIFISLLVANNLNLDLVILLVWTGIYKFFLQGKKTIETHLEDDPDTGDDDDDSEEEPKVFTTNDHHEETQEYAPIPYVDDEPSDEKEVKLHNLIEAK